MSQTHGGKGSKPRPVDRQKFDTEFDRIFGKKPIKPQPNSSPKETPNA